MKRLLIFLLFLSCQMLRVPAQPGAPTASNTNSHAPFVLNLQKLPLNEFLKQYGMLVHRTLLVAPYIPDASFTLHTTFTNSADAERILADALKTNGLLVIPDGEKFIMVVPKSMKPIAVPHSAELKSPPKTQASDPRQIIHGGEMDIYSVPMDKMLDLYLKMIGRQLDTSAPLPRMSGCISLHTENLLTKEEAIYAFDTLLAWNNVKVVPVSKDLARVEPAYPPCGDR